MERQPSPYADNELPLADGIIDMGVRTDPTQTALYYCNSSAGCKQHLYKKRHPYPPWIYFAGITFTSLAAIYLLLGCFEFLRGTPSAVGLARSLADGGEGPCQRAAYTDEKEQVVQAGGSEATPRNGNAAEGAAADDGQQARATTQLPRWDIAAPGEAGTAAPRVGISMKPPQQGEPAVGAESAQAYQEGHEISGGEAEGSVEQDLGGAAGTAGDGGPFSVAPGEQLREGESWEMWAKRGLPPYAEAQVTSLFERMVGDALLCQSLLPMLTPREGLLLAYQVVRLLTLDLGAIALVQDHIEPFRRQLGDALMDLGWDALQRSGDSGQLEDCRKDFRQLMLVTEKLKEPRPFTENTSAIKYRKKMTSILRTAETVESFCATILQAVLEATEGGRTSASSVGMEPRLRGLKALFRVHSNHVAKDASLRYFIIEAQKQAGVQPLLGPDHHRMATQRIFPLWVLIGEINEAVQNSGALERPPQMGLPQRPIAVDAGLPAAFWATPPHAQLHQLQGLEQQREGYMQGSLASPASRGSSTFQMLEAAGYPIVPFHSQSPAVPLGHPVPGSHASPPATLLVVKSESLRTLPSSSVPAMPLADGSSQGIQGSPSHFHTPTVAGSATAQSHQAAAAPLTELQGQPPIWLRGQQAVQGASSAHSFLLSPMSHGGHHSQAAPLAFLGPGHSSAVAWGYNGEQHSQQAPPSPHWEPPFAGRYNFISLRRGSDSADASMSVAEEHVPSSHGPAAAPHLGRRHLRHDLQAASASVQTSHGDSHGGYSLFGGPSRPPWLPASAATIIQPLTGPSRQMQSGQEGSTQQGEDDGSVLTRTPAGGLRLKDRAPRGPRDHTDK